MLKVLFVCHGNICRSPMAEFMFKNMVQEIGCADEFEIASAAVSSEEEGNPVYPPARRVLAEHGIDCRGKYARKMNIKDYEYYDYLICMDSSNMRNMQRICGGDKDNKMYKLLDFTGTPADVADPWYCGNFDGTWSDIHRGLCAFLDTLDIC